jgi:hypothetical protein
MKRITLIGILVVGLVALFAILTALNTGEKSPIYVAGTVELPGEMRADAEGIRTMFVSIFDEESQMPMPYGAMKEYLPDDLSKPIEFALTKEKMQIMNPNARMPRYMRVKVRFDKDGMAGADQPGDLVGIVEHVQFGAENVRLKIQQKI